MLEVAHADQTSCPWVAASEDGIAFLASAMPDGHDEGARRSRLLLRRVEATVLRSVDSPSAYSTVDLLKAVLAVLSEDASWAGYGVHLGLVLSTSERWRIWTAGLVSAALWAPPELTWTTEPQDVARHLRRQGIQQMPPMAEDIAKSVIQTGASVESFEQAEIERQGRQGVVLLGSARFGQALRAKAATKGYGIKAALDQIRSARDSGDSAPTSSFAALFD